MAFTTLIRYKTHGFDTLAKALDNLTEPKFRSQALRQAGRKAMTPTLTLLKNAAPVVKNPKKLPKGARVGQLRDSLTLRVSAPVQPKFSKKGKATKASKNELSAAIYTGRAAEDFALVSEYGRKETVITRYHVFGRPALAYEAILPKLTPKPWMRPTFDKDKGNIVDRFAKELGEAIARKARQQARLFEKLGKL